LRWISFWRQGIVLCKMFIIIIIYLCVKFSYFFLTQRFNFDNPIITVRLLLLTHSVRMKPYLQGFNVGGELANRMTNTLDRFTNYDNTFYYRQILHCFLVGRCTEYFPTSLCDCYGSPVTGCFYCLSINLG
jgi:hypothetical protein